MPTLEKATLQEIGAGQNEKPVPVQFNPQSLRLELSSRVEGGQTRGAQRRQYIGMDSTTLSFDLYFDTADLGTTGNPVSVRTQTAMVERFVLPKKGGEPTPPKCRFHWGELVIDGIIDRVSIDFELFAANGTPLRARMSVSIREQDAKYQRLEIGSGAKSFPNKNDGTGPGSRGGGPTDRSTQALQGETAADFAVRVGLDPAAWRGIAGQLGGGSTLALPAGASIDFSTGLSATAGLGISAGLAADAGVSLEASFGLAAGASASFSASAGVKAEAGFALTAAGGLGAALESVAIVQTAAEASAARRAFGSAVPAVSAVRTPAVNLADGATATGTASLPKTSTSALAASPDIPPAPVTPKPALPDQTRTPLRSGGPVAPARRPTAPSAPAPPRADPRADSFGRGVPLRPRVGAASDLRASVAAGRVPLRPQTPVAMILNAPDPAAAPWTRLPAGPVRSVADRAQARRAAVPPCGCKHRK